MQSSSRRPAAPSSGTNVRPSPRPPLQQQPSVALHRKPTNDNINLGGGGNNPYQSSLTTPTVSFNSASSTSSSSPSILSRVLSAANPNLNRNLVYYDFQSKEFLPLQWPGNHLQIHFSMDSAIVWGESEEGKEQINWRKMKEGAGSSASPTEKVSRSTDTNEEKQESQQGNDQDDQEEDGDSNDANDNDDNDDDHQGDNPQGDGDDDEDDDENDEKPKKKKRRGKSKGNSSSSSTSMSTGTGTDGGTGGGVILYPRRLKNQFNYSDRSSQVFTNPHRDRQSSTEPPPTTSMGGFVSRWEIFDAYVKDTENTMAAKKDAEKPARGKFTADEEEAATVATNSTQSPNTAAVPPRLLASLKTMERLVNQNSDSIYFHDYKYYEDTAETKQQDTNQLSVIDGGQSKSNKGNRRGSGTMSNRNAVNSSSLLQSSVTSSSSSSSSASSGPSSSISHPFLRGSFLPLWKFSHPESKKRTITSIAWNPAFPDLFSVGYGSYEFMKQHQSGGLISCFTLKNTHVPEYEFTTDSGVMSLAFHPTHPSLLVVGLYDGTVQVYDVRMKHNTPIYISTDPKTHHTDPVWHVIWGVDTEAAGVVGKQLNFYSISTDGRLTNWILGKNGLLNEEVVTIKLMENELGDTTKITGGGTGGGKNKGNGTLLLEEVKENDTATTPSTTATTTGGTISTTLPRESLLQHAGGTCFDFNPHLSHLFIVGTEEGALQLYSKAFHTSYIRSYSGHDMAIYTVKWNPYHPGVFLSGSADWTVKLWEINNVKPIMTFDMGGQIGDIAWSPYSSTVFAIVTSDGRVKIFDLSIHLHSPIGEITLLKKYGLTKISFNPHDPVILVGDERGVVHSLKLSANLRRTRAPTIDELDVEEELDALDRLLILPDRGVGEHPEYLRQFFQMKHREESSGSSGNAGNKDGGKGTIKKGGEGAGMDEEEVN